MATLLEIDNENELAREVKNLRDNFLNSRDAIEGMLDRLVELKDAPENSAYTTEIINYISTAKANLINLANKY